MDKEQRKQRAAIKNGFNEIAKNAIIHCVGMCPDNKKIDKIEELFLKRWSTDWMLNNDLKFHAGKEYAWLTLRYWQRYAYDNTNRAIYAINALGHKPQTIMDFGAGIGLSTLQLAKAFPEAQVVYQNLPGLQTDIAIQIFKDNGANNVVIKHDLPILADVVLALDTFEHIKNPLTLLTKVLTQSTKIYVDQSAFQYPNCVGHYDTYEVNGRSETPQDTMKAFYKMILEMGYHKEKMPFFNAIPKVFSKL